MRRLGTIVGITLALALGVGAYLYLTGAEYVVEVPEKDINLALQQRFPIEELHVEELPDEYRAPAREVINQALSRHVDGLVVYQLSSDSFQESLARLFLKDIEIGDEVLRASLGLDA